MIQWGTMASVGNSAPGSTFSFSPAFPNNCFGRMEWQFALQDSILDSLFSLTLPAHTALLPTSADSLIPGPSTGSQS